jgi:hypothetical protein
VFTSLLYYYGGGTRNIENSISSVGIKTTIGRIFMLLRKFNGDAAEVFSGSSKVGNTRKRQNEKKQKGLEKVRERIFKAIS